MAKDIQIVDHTDEFQDAFKRAKKNGLTAIGMTAEAYTKKNTPVDTGRLRNSMTHEEDDEATYIGTNVEYAPYVELGARGRPPVSMLRRAATEHMVEYRRLFLAALKSAKG